MITARSMVYCSSRTLPGKMISHQFFQCSLASKLNCGFRYFRSINVAKMFGQQHNILPRFRKGGTVISTVLIRYIRSFRNLFSLASSVIGRLVAQISLISMGTGRLEPSLVTCLFCSTLNNFAC